jgi:hypothetical protein
MTYEYKLSTGGYWLFTGRQALAVAAVAAMTPPLLAAAGAADAAPKHISP